MTNHSPPPDWLPGRRFSYRYWSRFERRTECRARIVQRSRITAMTDSRLFAFMEDQADLMPISWSARVAYRAAFHEATRVREWPDVPKDRELTPETTLG